MSMVFQRFGLLPHKTVLENVGFGLQIQGVPEHKRNKAAMDKIDLVGLTGFQHQYPEQLSGGMQQRVGLARALATDPDILLMDEAFSALDPLIRTEMQRQLLALQADMHKTIVFITHDLDEALRLGDHIGILNGGRLVQVGGPEEIIMHPADDYVTAFVQDVNRAKVLRAKTIMIDAHQLDGADMSATENVHEDTFLENFLSDVLERRTVLTVVDHQGNPKGYITDKEIAAALSKGN
jgi:glycine betaine/proline transport system ATP-binding protein